MPNPQQMHGAQRTLSDKMLAASTHVVRHHNHRGAKNRERYSLQCFRSSMELLPVALAARTFTKILHGASLPPCTITQKAFIFRQQWSAKPFFNDAQLLG